MLEAGSQSSGMQVPHAFGGCSNTCQTETAGVPVTKVSSCRFCGSEKACTMAQNHRTTCHHQPQLVSVPASLADEGSHAASLPGIRIMPCPLACQAVKVSPIAQAAHVSSRMCTQNPILHAAHRSPEPRPHMPWCMQPEAWLQASMVGGNQPCTWASAPSISHS